MSMLARFIQVEETELRQLLERPASVETVFMGREEWQGTIELTDKLRQAWQKRAPALLSGAMDGFDPATRAGLLRQMAERLGISEEELQQSQARTGEAIVRDMERRSAMLDSLMPRRPGTLRSKPAAPARRDLSLDKAWHGLHYLLGGSPDLRVGTTPAGEAVAGGAELGEDFSGYGPARYFDAAKVAAIARGLAEPGLEAQIRARYDGREMTRLEIYPGGWDTEDPAWVFEAFRNLRDFFAEAEANQRAIVTCIV